MAKNRRIDDIPEDYLACRDLLHAWTPYDARIRRADTTGRREIHRVLRCSRCKTLRTQRLDMQGRILSNSYSEYPEGYLLTGTGHLSAADRAAIRVRAVNLEA